jgi:hypothetical protein
LKSLYKKRSNKETHKQKNKKAKMLVLVKELGSSGAGCDLYTVSVS